MSDVPYKVTPFWSYFRCLINFHPWSQWSNPVKIEVWDSDNPRARHPIYYKLSQSRACQHCRRCESRSWKAV